MDERLCDWRRSFRGSRCGILSHVWFYDDPIYLKMKWRRAMDAEIEAVGRNDT